MNSAAAPTQAQILEALKAIPDPDRRQDIVALGMVQGLVVKDGHVGFSIEVDAKRGPHMEPVRKAAEKAIEALPGVLSVTAVLTAQKADPKAAPQRQAGTGPAGGPNQAGGKMLQASPVPDIIEVNRCAVRTDRRGDQDGHTPSARIENAASGRSIVRNCAARGAAHGGQPGRWQ